MQELWSSARNYTLVLFYCLLTLQEIRYLMPFLLKAAL